MTEIVYHLSILGAVLIAGICFVHAWGDRERLAFLGTSMLYGFLLEKAVIFVFGMHSYPTEQFLFNLWSVPVSIPLVWGVIMYSSLIAGMHIGLQRRHLPIFAGLFVLHIDLAIDAIAIRVPLWTWHVPGVWFDVPIVNFVGWYSVALLFTGCFLYIGEKTDRYVLAGVVSLVSSIALLLVIVACWLRFVSSSTVMEVALFGTIIGTSLVYLLRADVQPDLYLDRFPAETFVSVVLIHLFYLQMSLYYGYYRDQTVLIYICIFMILVAVSVHYLPYMTEEVSELTETGSEPLSSETEMGERGGSGSSLRTHHETENR